MIKNLLYSIFLHSLLIAIIYANFNLKNYRQDEVIKVAVNLVAIDGSPFAVKKNNDDTMKKNQAEPKKDQEKKPAIKDDQIPKSPKKSNQDQVKKPPKKAAVTKNKQVQENKKQQSNSVSKNNQFKKPKDDQKDPKTELNKEDQKLDDKDVEVNHDSVNKEEDLGAKIDTFEENPAEAKDAAALENNDNINSLENINLSLREKFNIQSQLRVCYKRAIKENGKDSQIKITIKVNIAEDGSIEANFDDIIDVARYNNLKDHKYKIAIDNAKKALELCSPLRNLPLDKYDIWKEVLLEFDENMKN